MKRLLTCLAILLAGTMFLAGGVVFGEPIGWRVADGPDTVIVDAGGSGSATLTFDVPSTASRFYGAVLVDSVAQGPADSIRVAWRPLDTDAAALLGWRAALIDTNCEEWGTPNWIATSVGVGFVPIDSTWYPLLLGNPSAREPELTWKGSLAVRVTVYGSEDDTVAVRGWWRYVKE